MDTAERSKATERGTRFAERWWIMRSLLALAFLLPTVALAEEIPGFTLDKVTATVGELPAVFGETLLDDHFVNRAECYRLTGQGAPSVCTKKASTSTGDAVSGDAVSADTTTHDAGIDSGIDAGDACAGTADCEATPEDTSAGQKPGKADSASAPDAFKLTYSLSSTLAGADITIAVGTGCTVAEAGITPSATCKVVKQLGKIAGVSGLTVEAEWPDLLGTCASDEDTYVWFGVVQDLLGQKKVYSTRLTITLDYAPPVAPTLGALEAGDQNLHASWTDDKNDNETGITYTVYWSTQAFTSASLPGGSKGGLTSTSVQVTGLTNNTEYYVGVVAVDEVGNESEICDAATELETGKPIVVDDFFEYYKKNGGHEKGGYSCFVATAAWGTPAAPAVTWLRGFRDTHLLTNEGGKALVDLYYRVGPTAAQVIARHDWLRALARLLLWPLVLVVLAVAAWPITGPLFAAAGAWAVRRSLRRRREARS